MFSNIAGIINAVNLTDLPFLFGSNFERQHLQKAVPCFSINAS